MPYHSNLYLVMFIIYQIQILSFINTIVHSNVDNNSRMIFCKSGLEILNRNWIDVVANHEYHEVAEQKCYLRP